MNAVQMATGVAVKATETLFAEKRQFTLEKFKYALESWRRTPASARCSKAQLSIVKRDKGFKLG
jgi:hypothetical protein